MIGALRLVIGFTVLFGWCVFSRRLPDLKSWSKPATIIAALGIVGYQMLFFAAAKITGVAISAVVAGGFNTVAAGVLGFIFLREKPKSVWYLTTLVAVAGLVTLSFTPDMQANPLGLLLACLSSAAFALYTVFSKRVTKNVHPATLIMVLFAIGSVLVIPIFFIYPVDWIFTARGILVTLHLGLIATALGYALLMAGLMITPASTCATIILSEALMATCWGVFLLGEYLGSAHWVGMAMIFGAVGILTLKSK